MRSIPPDRLSTRFVSALGTPLLLLGSASVALADIDLTGRWRTPASTNGYAEIVQTGTAVTLTLKRIDPMAGEVDFVFTGTFDQQTVIANSGGACFLGLQALGGGSVLDGTIRCINSLSSSHWFFARCECDDDNEDDGDGCSSLCEIEPCYSCAGQPSTCVPSADSTVCDDGNDCTQGETCAAGECGSGSPVSPCVDLDGIWRVSEQIPDFMMSSVSEQRYVQDDGLLLAFGASQDLGTTPWSVGTVEPASGILNLVSRGGSGHCTTSSRFSATVASGGLTFAGEGNANASTPMICLGFSTIVGGNRCDEEAGCDLADCVGHPDGTPCIDEDPCTNRESCSAGVCRGKSACLPCSHCDGTGSCVIGPQPTCRQSVVDDSSRLKFNDRSPDEKDKLSWQWKRGDATTLDELGDLPTSEAALCVYDESGAEPSLMFQGVIGPYGNCENPPCWTAKADGWSYRNKSPDAGSMALSLKTGESGKAGINLRAKGYAFANGYASLDEPPLNLPLRVQFQVDTGACFEAVFDSDGVKRNESGAFSAVGGPVAP